MDDSWLPTVHVEVERSTIQPTRKLRARWTLEAEQDLRAFHIDTTEELLNIFGRPRDDAGELVIYRDGIMPIITRERERVNWQKDGF